MNECVWCKTYQRIRNIYVSTLIFCANNSMMITWWYINVEIVFGKRSHHCPISLWQFSCGTCLGFSVFIWCIFGVKSRAGVIYWCKWISEIEILLQLKRPPPGALCISISTNGVRKHHCLMSWDFPHLTLEGWWGEWWFILSFFWFCLFVFKCPGTCRFEDFRCWRADWPSSVGTVEFLTWFCPLLKFMTCSYAE